MSEAIEFRRARPEDAPGICDLYAATRTRTKSQDQFRWLYEDNPAGPHRTWVAVETATGKIVSARPVFPWWVSVAGRRILASQAGDAATLPEWRGRGLFTRLV
ncbi:MAG: GNAT family N-acetyltransferase, partial [Limisphaerales bacterium]